MGPNENHKVSNDWEELSSFFCDMHAAPMAMKLVQPTPYGSQNFEGVGNNDREIHSFKGLRVITSKVTET